MNVFERAVCGREFFEAVIRENIDLGRPSRMQLLFDRRIQKNTPGQFRTRVITAGVAPSLHVEYKHTGIKQYFKENRALRTETTINDARDFGIGRQLKNLPALAAIGHHTNARLLEVQRLSEDCVLSPTSIQRLTQPTLTLQASVLRGSDSPTAESWPSWPRFACSCICRRVFAIANCVPMLRPYSEKISSNIVLPRVTICEDCASKGSSIAKLAAAGVTSPPMA
jgi:hypothetical protein